MAEETTRPHPRRNILLIAFAVLIFIIIVGYGIYDLSSSSRLGRQLAELRSRGRPTNAEELNAFYAVPSNVSDTTEHWTAATTAIANADIRSRNEDIPIVGHGPAPVPPPGEEWSDLEVSRAFLKDLNSEMQLIRRAADAGGMARYPVDFTAGYNAILAAQQETRTMARLLTLNAHVHAHDGMSSETLKDVTAIFAVSDSLRGEPILNTHLMRIAIHAIGCELVAEMLPHCNWTDAELQDLQLVIGRADFRSEMLTAFHGELAICLDAIDNTPQIVLRDANKSKVIRLLTESTDGLATSWLEAVKCREAASIELKKMSANTLSNIMFPALMDVLRGPQNVIDPGIRAEARQNCCIAAIAEQRHRLKHGKLPKPLVDLNDFIPNEDPSKSSRLIDPFDGQPLRFKYSNESVIIYSVGENKIDNGGEIDNESPMKGDVGYSISE